MSSEKKRGRPPRDWLEKSEEKEEEENARAVEGLKESDNRGLRQKSLARRGCIGVRVCISHQFSQFLGFKRAMAEREQREGNSQTMPRPGSAARRRDGNSSVFSKPD